MTAIYLPTADFKQVAYCGTFHTPWLLEAFPQRQD
ncbi:MAG: hypothetical protein ACI89J_001333, partial [Hyphomicrobiaceae bacterium]